MYPSSVAGGGRHSAGFVDYLEQRLRRVRHRLGQTRVSSMYVGGGTPSLLSADELGRLFGALEQTFDVKGDVTFEGHPSSLGGDKIDRLVSLGVNRISLGVQATQPRVLAAVGRENPPLWALNAVAQRVIRHGVFLNVDLMIGLPTQTASDVTADLRWALGLGPRCITLYRYQPVPGLAAPSERVTFADLSWPALAARVLGAGYLPVWNGARDAFAASFFRPLPQRWPRSGALPERLSGLAHLVRSGGFGRALPARARLVHFTGFDVGAIHVMGFGPGAISHLYGGAWYRDDRSPAALNARTTPRLAGRTFRLEDELCIAVSEDLVRGRWVRRADQLASVGLDPWALLDRLPERLADALQRTKSRARLRLDHSEAAGAIRWLLEQSSKPPLSERA